LYKEFDKIKLKDGRTGTVVDFAGPDYLVDIGETEKDFETILVLADEIEGKAE